VYSVGPLVERENLVVYEKSKPELKTSVETDLYGDFGFEDDTSVTCNSVKVVDRNTTAQFDEVKVVRRNSTAQFDAVKVANHNPIARSSVKVDWYNSTAQRYSVKVDWHNSTAQRCSVKVDWHNPIAQYPQVIRLEFGTIRYLVATHYSIPIWQKNFVQGVEWFSRKTL